MESTEPANNDHCPTSAASTCGLVGSLFPRSCRGRAEAFARRLHRRLTSLSGNDEEIEDHIEEKPNETSWLQSNHHNDGNTSSSRVLDHQPRHSSETDLYYDFDFSPEHETDDPGSPEEVVTAAELATLLVNHSELFKKNHHDACHCKAGTRPPDDNRENESGYDFSSPVGSNTPSESEAYYDPESSETEKTKTDDFYDPINTSESDVQCQLSNGDENNIHKPPGRRRNELMNGKKNDETSDESSLSVEQNQPNNQINTKINNSSEESLNDVASSLETTSPSHESLWSTFDDSTVSLQDDVSSVGIISSETRFLKSHSDSELVPGITRVINGDIETPSSDEIDFTNNHLPETIESKCNGDEIKKDPLDVNESIPDNNEDVLTYSSTFDLPGPFEVQCPVDKSQLTESNTMKNEINFRVTETVQANSPENVSKLLRKLSCTPHASFDKSFDNEEKEENNEEHEEEEIDGRPKRLRRCSSLKTGKTPPGTPGRKKIVRFADVLGLDLADVRTFLDEIPKVPNSAYSDLIYDDVFQKDSSPSLYGSSPTTAGVSVINVQNIVKSDRMLVPMFQQPGGLANFMDLIRDRQVCLENVIVQDPITLCIQGTVRVRNLDFHKSVHIRYTMDSWKSFSDLQGLYVDGSCDGFSDKFTFILYCHTLRIGEKLELAVRFQCKGVQYWDNNAGLNYCFQCLPMTPISNYVPITLASTQRTTHDWNPTFY